MKWEYFIYARGIEQNDGFKLRAGPEYVSKDVIKGCQGFFSARERFKMFREELEANGIEDRFAENDTFIFLPIKQYGCCIFMRAVKVESAETGEYYTDFQDRPVWSLEGICCPYERASYFFACLPSILLWFKRNEGRSLCTMHSSGRINGNTEIPEGMIFDPTSGVLPDFGSVNLPKFYTEAFLRLTKKIAAADVPFPFIFGALAEQVYRTVGAAYRISEFVQFTNEQINEEYPDAFSSYSPVRIRQERPVGIKTEYILKLGISPEEGSYTWYIAEIKPNTEENILSSRPERFYEDEGISVLKLMSEAELIREFASNMGWSTEPFSSDCSKVYKFVKEI